MTTIDTPVTTPNTVVVEVSFAAPFLLGVEIVGVQDEGPLQVVFTADPPITFVL